jgi:opacity protein-like surface antigen
MNKKLAAIAILAFASIPPAIAADIASFFSKGRTHVSIYGGNGYAFDDSYLVLGLGVSHYLIDGFNVGLSFESWSGADPSMYNITPSVQYVFYQVPRLTPYLGGFYRRAYIEGRPDLNSAGARAGVYITAGSNAYIGVGAVYESYIDCNKATYLSCHDTYPEVSFTFAF